MRERRRGPCSSRPPRSTRPTSWSIAVLTEPASLAYWDWVKWLPHAQSRREADAAGPRRLVCTDLDELVSLLPADLSERARFGPSRTAISPHVVVVLDNVTVPVGHSVITDDGVLGMTVIDIPERWDELSDDSRVRLHLEASDDPRDEGRVRVAAVVPRQEPIRGFADQMTIATAEAAARRLTPLYAGEGPAREDALTKSTELTDLLGIARRPPARPRPHLAPAPAARPAARADRRRRRRRLDQPRHQGVRAAGHGAARPGHRRDRAPASPSCCAPWSSGWP